MKTFGMVVVVVFAMLASARAGDMKPIKPAQADKCPVCGMFVAKYPDFIAEIVFKDGSYVVFDGVKDLVKCYHRFESYHPSKKTADIDSIFVTDYYSLTPIDGLKAFYVVGSDVYGPMGKEMIPFETEAAAREFMADHHGETLLPFNALTAELAKSLD